MSLLEILVPPLRRAREHVEELERELDDLERKRDIAHRRALRAENRLNTAQVRLKAGNLPLCPTLLRDIYKTENSLPVKRQYQCENLHNVVVFGEPPNIRVTNSGRR